MNKVFSTNTKTLANLTQKHIKRIMPQDQVGFVLGMKVWFNIHKSVNMIQISKYDDNRMKDKNHIAISKNAERTFDKIQHSSMIKIILKMLNGLDMDISTQ